VDRPLHHGERAGDLNWTLSVRRYSLESRLVPREDLVGGGWRGMGNPHQAEHQKSNED